MTHLMKLVRNILMICMVLSFVQATAQEAPLLGSWQLVSHVSCLEEASGQDSQEAVLRRDMQTRSSASAQVVTFKEKAKGVQSSRILNTSRVANSRNFLYRYNGELLLILDKKSQTITDSYFVEKLSADSLVVSSRSRPCDTRIFVKIHP